MLSELHACRARKPFNPHKLWEFTNKYFHVQQPEMHDHDHGDGTDDKEEAALGGKKRAAPTSADIICSKVGKLILESLWQDC